MQCGVKDCRNEALGAFSIQRDLNDQRLTPSPICALCLAIYLRNHARVIDQLVSMLSQTEPPERGSSIEISPPTPVSG